MHSVWGKIESTVSQQTQSTLSTDKMHASKMYRGRELCWTNYCHHLMMYFIDFQSIGMMHPSVVILPLQWNRTSWFIFIFNRKYVRKVRKCRGVSASWADGVLRGGVSFSSSTGLLLRPLVRDVAPLALFLSLCTSVFLCYLLQQYASVCKHLQNRLEHTRWLRRFPS